MKLIRTAVLVAAAVAAVNKAKEYARDNPEAASGTIDKAESFVRDKAGPKYADTVGKGSQALRQGLGLPRAAGSSAGTSTATTSSADPSSPTPGAAQTPAGFDPAI
ncbi:MAG TPA: antitoxin [Ornithinibacter sp.]|nr:antitoxin [Ornithinibacter sp.]